MEDQVTAHLTDESGDTKGIRLEDFNGMEATADVDSNGRLKITTAYPDARQPPQNEDGTVQACGLLTLKLKQSGEHWVRVEHDPGQQSGVDCIASTADGTSTLLMSVTRVGPQEFRKRLGRHQQAGDDLPAQEMAEHIFAAIRRKASADAPAQRREKMLVLDARDVVGYVATAVISQFRQHHGRKTAQYGYRAVWIVGPSIDLMHRLDAGSDTHHETDPTGTSEAPR